jgi:hypothetical protein
MMFALGEGGTAAGKRESQREENDSNCSEFHFSPFLNKNVFQNAFGHITLLLFNPERTHIRRREGIKT